MKIFRSELHAGLKNKLFEIPGNSLALENIAFTSDKIVCTLNSEQVHHGFLLHGKMQISTLEQCDRCLIDFEFPQDINMSFLLADNLELISDDQTVLFYNDQNETVDMGSVISEKILLERPIKHLCKKQCKGLCSSCGCNFNEKDCNCTNELTDDRWDKLRS